MRANTPANTATLTSMKSGMHITKSQLVLDTPSITLSGVGKIGGDDGGNTEISQPVLAYTIVSPIQRTSTHASQYAPQ